MSDSIYDRIQAGEFENTIERPKRSGIKRHGNELHYKHQMEQYWKGEREARERFKNVILYDVGLENHPNAAKIFEYAWEEGHSSGLHEVYMRLCEISELFFVKGKMLDTHIGV